MEVENIYCYQEIYNKIKSYVVRNQIQISGCLITKIIALISIYRNFYMLVDEEQINMIRLLKLLNQ